MNYFSGVFSIESHTHIHTQVLRIQMAEISESSISHLLSAFFPWNTRHLIQFSTYISIILESLLIKLVEVFEMDVLDSIRTEDAICSLLDKNEGVNRLGPVDVS